MGKLNYRASENHDNDEEKSPSVKGAYRRKPTPVQDGVDF